MRQIYIVTIFIYIYLSGCNNVDNLELIKRKSTTMEDSQVVNFSQMEYSSVPEEYILDVPFVMQAPFANWEVHNESCEEAGILLPHYYYLGQVLTKDVADRELLAMVDYQKKNYGGEYDIYAEEMGRLASDFYGYNQYKVLDGSVENLKSELLAGNPVIVPTTAAYLKTEKSDYPEMGYHVVVVVGYNQRGFVTHDPGTYSGEDFTYSYDILSRSMTDYDNKVLVLK